MVEKHILSSSTRRMLWLLRIICFLMLTLLVVLAVLLVLAPAALVPAEQANPLTDLPPGALRGLGIAFVLLLLAAPLWGVLSLVSLTGCYLRGEVFSPRPAGHLTALGSALIAAAVLKFAMLPFLGLLGWLATVEGGAQGEISVAFGTGELALIGGGLLLRSIGRVLMDAASIAQENQEFI